MLQKDINFAKPFTNDKICGIFIVGILQKTKFWSRVVRRTLQERRGCRMAETIFNIIYCFSTYVCTFGTVNCLYAIRQLMFDVWYIAIAVKAYYYTKKDRSYCE
jgi:hypothetical protein